jgi:hypothetical protein
MLLRRIPTICRNFHHWMRFARALIQDTSNIYLRIDSY